MFLDPFQMTENRIVIDLSPISRAGKGGGVLIIHIFDVLHARIVLNPFRKGEQLRES